jgi:hypothetical protein
MKRILRSSEEDLAVMAELGTTIFEQQHAFGQTADKWNNLDNSGQDAEEIIIPEAVLGDSPYEAAADEDSRDNKVAHAASAASVPSAHAVSASSHKTAAGKAPAAAQTSYINGNLRPLKRPRPILELEQEEQPHSGRNRSYRSQRRWSLVLARLEAEKLQAETAKARAETAYWLQKREDEMAERRAKGLPVSRLDMTLPSLVRADNNLLSANVNSLLPSDSDSDRDV